MAFTGKNPKFTTVNKVTITQPATSATLTIANGKTLELTTGNLTLVSNASNTTATLPASGAITLMDLGTAQSVTGQKTFTNPIMTTPTLGAASATSINFGGTTLSAYDETTNTVACSSGASGINNLTTAINHTVLLTRVGKAVTCVMYSASQGTKSSTNGYVEILGLIPAGYRPSDIIYPVITWGIGSNVAVTCRVAPTNGDVRIYNNTSASNIPAGTTTIGSFERAVFSWTTQ